MSDHPIIFSGPMVRAILEGRKTQTRRVITASNSTVLGRSVSKYSKLWTSLVWNKRVYKDKGPHILHPVDSEYLHVPWCDPNEDKDGRVFRVRSRYEPGDHFWVRETWTDLWSSTIYLGDIIYKATPPNAKYIVSKWKPSIFMPRWASRIILEITEVRVQRIQEITEEDAVAEGIASQEIIPIRTARQSYRVLWDSLNAKRGYGWNGNPWVWVLNFRKSRMMAGEDDSV